MAIIRTNLDTTINKDLLKEGGLRKLFDDTLGEAQVFYKELVNDLTTKDEYVRDQQIAGLTLPSAIAEGQNIPIQAPVLGSAKTYTQGQSATGFRMTWKMDFFNKYNLWKRWAKSLAKVMKEGKDIDVHLLFNTPLGTYTGFQSGEHLAEAAHTGLLAGSSTDSYSNYLDAGLSYSSLESARYYFKTMKDSLGCLMSASPTHLVFEPTLYTTVQELLKSDLKPFEDSNTINAFKGYGIKTYEDPRLTSTTMWFMIDKSDGYDINVFTSKEPDMVTQDAPDTTRDRIATSMQAYSFGWGDARKFYLGNG